MQIVLPPCSSPIIPPPALVLFDLDDTLCDYASARAKRLRIAFTEALATRPEGAASIDLDSLIAESIAIQPHGSDHFESLLGRAGITDPAVIERVSTWYRTNRFYGLKLFDDALDTIHAIRQALPHRRIGIVTNGPADVQRDKIALLNLTPAVDFVLISEEIGIAKPDPAIFAEALRRANVTPDEAIMVGDSPEFDIAGASAAGIRAIWVNRAGRPWQPGLSPAAYEVHALSALRHLLGPPGEGQ
ncbi:MAG: hydrolase [Thermomicrobiales bacterium]|nr:MAG: hydrolase [Thermomicrobiales bacterium]